MEIFTLVKTVLVLLALCATASHSVDLVHEATASLGRSLLALSLVGVVVATGEVLDEIHDDNLSFEFEVGIWSM
jgi:hypothetical protein